MYNCRVFELAFFAWNKLSPFERYEDNITPSFQENVILKAKT